MNDLKSFIPSHRYDSFTVFENLDGHSFHIIAVSGSAGRIFADGFGSWEDAEWTASLLNAAIGLGTCARRP